MAKLNRCKQIEQTDSNFVRIFVYGSLMMGMNNHSRFLMDEPEVSTFISTAKILAKMGTTHSAYPFIIPSDNHKVIGEVYDVDQELFDVLDEMEKSNCYFPCNTKTLSGDSVVVWYKSKIPYQYYHVENGDWRTCKTKLNNQLKQL